MDGIDLGRATVSFVGRPVSDIERAHILATLAEAYGNRTHAATALGISVRTLRNKLNLYAAAGYSIPAFDRERPASG